MVDTMVMFISATMVRLATAKRVLNVLQRNVQDTRNMHATIDLAKLLHDHDIHVTLLQETLLTEDNQCTISGYVTTRCICVSRDSNTDPK